MSVDAGDVGELHRNIKVAAPTCLLRSQPKMRLGAGRMCPHALPGLRGGSSHASLSCEVIHKQGLT